VSKTVEYFLAPQSPWAYIGHPRFMQVVKNTGATVLLKPADVVKIFAASGGVPVGQRPPQRQAYRLDELRRWSAHLKRPLNLHPKFFPVAGDLANKLMIAALHAGGTDKALALAGALGSAVWANEQNIADTDTLVAIANGVGLDGAAVLKLTDSDAVAADYARNTEEAIEAKVFGVPWYRVDGEGFWGQDRLDFVERLLAP
jgi:2-hydroxychromene-2-carboxylate isomerase